MGTARGYKHGLRRQADEPVHDPLWGSAEPPTPKLQITRTQYMAELNQRLKAHPDYVPGMEFVPYPGPDPEQASGYDWLPKAHPRHQFVEVAHEVMGLFYV